MGRPGDLAGPSTGPTKAPLHVLVTGATGYIGGRLIPRLLNEGHEITVLTRSASRLKHRPWAHRVRVSEGDLLKPETLDGAFESVEAAYYLVHSMDSGPGFEERDKRAAKNFVEAAEGLEQTIYLGGILPDGNVAGARSDHLKSRAEVGAILRAHRSATELRAGPIIGSGSASFEMVRYLTERLPAMVAPKWISNEVQPIAVRDVLRYLIAVLGRRDAEGVIDVGSSALTFKQMMEVYAEVRGLERLIVPVPVLAPKLAALWVGLVTPISNSLAVPLIEGVVQPVVGDTRRAESLFPEVRPMPYREAVVRALDRIASDAVSTRWTGSGGEDDPYKMVDEEGVFSEVRRRYVDVPPQRVFEAFSSLGGARGWLVWEWAWRLRGWVDQLFGGPGLRRGRRHPTEVHLGEAIDFWRVEVVEPPHVLRLKAEMKLPGSAWLQFEALPAGDGTELIQTASFAPRGAPGVAYWYGIYPLHGWIFSDLVNAIAKEARVLYETSPREARSAVP